MQGETQIAPAMQERSAVERAFELAQRQFGPIARRQLLQLGFTRGRIEHWMHAGRLHRRYPGVYAWGRPDLSTRGDLAAGLLYAGRGAALGGVSALWWMDLLERRPDRIQIEAPGRKASTADLSIRHPDEVRRTWQRGLPVAELPQVLLVSTDVLGRDSLRLVLARAEFHHLLHFPSLHAAVPEGRRGSRALRAAMAAHLPQLAACVNRFERDFVLLCERFAIELPEPNPRIGRYRPDMLWREQRLIVELDGETAHSTPAQLAAAGRRELELRRRGYVVIRFTWWEVQFEPERVAAKVRSFLVR